MYPDVQSKVSDMVFTLNKFILVDKSRTPVYESIVDKVERIVKTWKERKANLKELYREAESVFREINLLRQRQKELGLSDTEYYMLNLLEKNIGQTTELPSEVKELARDVQKTAFKGWSIQPSAVKEVGIIVRRYLRKQKISKEKRDDLYDKIIRMLKESD
jgi:type I restriction enzyme R subunit